MQQRIALAVQLDHSEHWEYRIGNCFKGRAVHMPPTYACRIQGFLTATDLTAQIAFVGEPDIALIRWWNFSAAARQEIIGAGMKLP